MTEKRGHFIAGRDVPASDGRTMRVVSPANDSVLAEVAQGTTDDVEAAVSAARGQLDGGEWSGLSGEERGRLINRLADLVERDADTLADLDAACIGRPGMEPRLLDLPNTISTLRTCAGWADKIEGRTIPTPGYMGTPTLSYTVREPVGVVGAIIPWNTPLMITSPFFSCSSRRLSATLNSMFSTSASARFFFITISSPNASSSRLELL